MLHRLWKRYVYYCLSPVLQFNRIKICNNSPIIMVSIFRGFYFCLAIDDDVVWRSGLSVSDASNHSIRTYDSNRVSLLHLLISLLSQPLFHAPEEYLVILNPFATYLTSRRCKNVKNLFISLLNVIISYDTTGYVSNQLLCKHIFLLGNSIHERYRYSRRD